FEILWFQFTSVLKTIRVPDIIDILLVAFIIYQVIKLIKETRAGQLIKGMVALLLLYFVANRFNLETISFIMQNVLATGVTALVIVFQPELRRTLEHVAQSRFSKFNPFSVSQDQMEEENRATAHTIDVVCEACENLSINKTGALIVFERNTRLGEIIQSGTVIDAVSSTEIVGNIFFVNTPLHDGAMIIREGRIYAAGCFLPLSENYTISKEMGTRHRAALGMSENSDAVVVVVSEETGIISLAQSGKIERRYTINLLKQRLRKELLMSGSQEPKQSTLSKVLRKVKK
ncbi:MAG: diadenylate cyclase CdaA, partial [Oscillospiraceae bacterium]